jgi:hypothetical protein
MPGSTWDSIFDGNQNDVRKALYGSALVKDYDPTISLASYSPFNESDGLLASTLLTTDGWTDLGYLDENGVQFTPTYTVSDTNTWQSRQALRADVTADTEQAMVTCLQSTPLTDALYQGLPISALDPIGTAGYSQAKPKVPQLVYRSVLFIGVDGAAGSYEFIARLYPKCLMIKPDKQAWQAKTEIQIPLTFQPYPDTLSGFTLKNFREGPGWRSRGVPAAPTDLVATPGSTSLSISWTAPVVPSGAPAVSGYTVSVTKVSDGTAATGSPFSVAAGTTSKSVTGLTASQPYTVSVTAQNANGSSPAATTTGTPTA